MVTDQQVAILRQRQMEGKKQQTSAAMAGMSERSARKWQCGPLPSESKTGRRWRTRPDPFDGVWAEEILPLLEGEAAGKLRATTIIDWLEEQHPGRFSASQLRTLQRRLQDWRALNGPDQEVYFPQEHPPGREAQLDFTHCNSLGVTVGRRPYRHLLFQLVPNPPRDRCRGGFEGVRRCSRVSGIMVFDRKTDPGEGAPFRCYHLSTPTVSGSPSTTTTW